MSRSPDAPAQARDATPAERALFREGADILLAGSELRRVPVLPTCDACTRAAQPDLRGALAEFHQTNGIDKETP